MRASLPILLLLGAIACQVPLGPPSVHPNEGLHGAVPCEACHVPDRSWDDVERACAGCHEASRPTPHGAGSCETCHDVFGWAAFTCGHEALPLTEGHEGLACTACHRDGVSYAAALPECASCHRTPGPEPHLGPECGRCHGTDSWSQAEVDSRLHVPLPHGGRSDCIGCHRDPDGPAAGWSCTHCHAHGREAMDEAHEGIPQFPLDRERCLWCHPTATAP